MILKLESLSVFKSNDGYWLICFFIFKCFKVLVILFILILRFVLIVGIFILLLNVLYSGIGLWNCLLKFFGCYILFCLLVICSGELFIKVVILNWLFLNVVK